MKTVSASLGLFMLLGLSQGVAAQQEKRPCDSAQQSSVISAITVLKSALDEALRVLDSSATADIDLFVEWFGAPASDTVANVRSVFAKAKGFTSFQTFYCPLSSTDIVWWEPGDIAAVRPDEPLTIYLAADFFSLVNGGALSKAGAIMHELSHESLIGDTDDLGYGATQARSLAKSDPAKARKNADNYRLFMEDAHFGI